MNRRFGAVAIVLMALTALAAVCSFVFFSQPVPKKSTATQPTIAGDSRSARTSTSTSASSPSLTPPPNPASSAALPQSNLRPDQPAEFRPLAHPKEPNWKLLDWSVKPFPGRPGVEMRASSWAAPGKHSFVRLEEEIKKDASGNLVVLHRKEMVGDQIIVKLPQGATQQAAEAMASQIGGRAGSQPFAPETWIFKLKQNLDSVPNGIQALNSSGAVLDYTEPDLILRSLRTPNDPNFNDLWHLFNRTNNDKDIRAARAWDKRTSALYNSTNRVIVAVIDSGVRYTHEDLAANIWINPRENPNDSLDNDNNGYVNDVYGIDAYGTEEFVDSNFNAKRDPDTIPGFGSNAESYTDANFNGRWDSDSDPMPATTNDDGHGTHCAGLIGAVGDNGKGVVGVAWSFSPNIYTFRFSILETK